MGTYLVTEVYTVEADDQEAALAAAELGKTKDSVVYVSDSLRTMFHPGHLQDVVGKYGHVQPPAPVEAPQAQPEPEVDGG